jgi:hypothetical protein
LLLKTARSAARDRPDRAATIVIDSSTRQFDQAIRIAARATHVRSIAAVVEPRPEAGQIARRMCSDGDACVATLRRRVAKVCTRGDRCMSDERDGRLVCSVTASIAGGAVPPRSYFSERDTSVKNKMIIAAVAASAVAAATGSAVAGIKSYISTSIQRDFNGPGSGLVSGIYSTARDSADANEYFACYVDTSKAQNPSASCFASTTAQGYAQCYTSDPQLISAIRSAKDDTSMVFMWDTTGQCTYVWTGFSSMWAQKAP